MLEAERGKTAALLFFLDSKKSAFEEVPERHVPNQLDRCYVLPEEWHVRGRTQSGSRLCKSLDFFSISGREMQL
jgi:hypothetical protein